MKTLLVAGTWDLNKGKESSLIKKLYLELLKDDFLDITYFNGGNYNDLNEILQSTINYDIVFWMVNVPNELEKIRNVKEINPKVMLITSKRNINKKYCFQELIQRALSSKSNLLIEFSNKENIYNMRVFDPLGNVWYDGIEIENLSKALVKRLKTIINLTRQKTINNNDKFSDLKYDRNFNFIEIVKKYGNIFANATLETIKVERYLGNASFRCMKGFPSFRNNGYIMVSKRNVNKESISINDFVPVLLENDNLYYFGESKPSVDTPIQVRLYEKFININYMIHSHCYIKGANFTKEAIPCGAIEEVYEIYNFIKDNYNNDFTKDFYVINLKGHGSIMMAKNIEYLENIEIIGRLLPEIM